MIPFSYITHTIRLLTSIIHQASLLKMLLRLLLSVKFGIYGLVYFPLALVVDTFVFFGNLYTEASVDSLNSITKTFSREGLELFEETIDDIIRDLEQKKIQMIKNKEDISLTTSANGGLLMEMSKVTIILQQKFDVIGEVSKLIFENR